MHAAVVLSCGLRHPLHAPACSDLSRTAEVFARENIELKAQVEQLQDDKEDSHKSSKAMHHGYLE